MRWAFAFVLSLPPWQKDAWFGADKAKHFVVAAAIQSVSYSLWRDRGVRSEPALWRATAVTATASLGKEAFDRSRGRAFSVRDLAWDAGGAGAASIVIIQLRGK
jgi:putative lipoprotein